MCFAIIFIFKKCYAYLEKRMRKMCSNSHHQRRRVQEMEWDNNPNRKLIAHAETFHVQRMLY